MRERAFNYLSNYISVTFNVKLTVLKHCHKYGIVLDIKDWSSNNLETIDQTGKYLVLPNNNGTITFKL